MMKIYTKTGDLGETSLWGGRKVSKSELRIEAYGTVDELNSWIGWLRDGLSDSATKEYLEHVQNKLFSIGAALSADPQNSKLSFQAIHPNDLPAMEAAIDRMDETLEPLKNFILPGGHPLVSQCQVARTVCRRAERRVVALSKQETVAPEIIVYLNRLSDYLFTLARYTAKLLGVTETPWKSSGE